VKQQIEDVIGLDTSNAVLCSAKAGIGIKEVLSEFFSMYLRLQIPLMIRCASDF
jgi:translation elongation factor EF-4